MNTTTELENPVMAENSLSGAIIIDLRMGYPVNCKQVACAAQKVRQFFYKNTGPWDGSGAIKGENFMDFCAKMDALISEFNSEVVRASTDETRSKFYSYYTTRPIEKGDYKGVSDLQNERINEIINSHIARNLNNLEINLINRVRCSLVHLAGCLINPDRKLHLSTVTNVFESINEARSLNIANNQALVELFEYIELKCQHINIEEARTNLDRRDEAVLMAGGAMERIGEVLGNY